MVGDAESGKLVSELRKLAVPSVFEGGESTLKRVVGDIGTEPDYPRNLVVVEFVEAFLVVFDIGCRIESSED